MSRYTGAASSNMNVLCLRPVLRECVWWILCSGFWGGGSSVVGGRLESAVVLEATKGMPALPVPPKGIPVFFLLNASLCGVSLSLRLWYASARKDHSQLERTRCPRPVPFFGAHTALAHILIYIYNMYTGVEESVFFWG